MSCRSSNILEYTFTSLLLITCRPVSSLISRYNASSSVSPFLILPPGNHHCPLAGLFCLRKNNNELSFDMIASTEGIGIESVINS